MNMASIARPLGALRSSATLLRQAPRLQGRWRAIPRHSLTLGTQHARRHFSIHPLIEATNTIIVSTHNFTGLPWYLCLPLIAIAVNITFRLPIVLFIQRLMQRRASVAPLLQAWHLRIVKELQRETRGKPLSEKAQMEASEKRLKAVEKRLYAKLGLQQWKAFSHLAVLPIWITVMDGIRRISGLEGSALIGWITGSGNPEDGESLKISGGQTTTGSTSVDILPAPQSTSMTASESIDNGRSFGLEPSLITEGALWFPDLSVADPYHILPFVLSAVLMLNVFPKGEAARVAMFGKWAAFSSSKDAKVPTPTATTLRRRIARGLHRGLFGASAMMGLFTLGLPASMHLYWISSSLTVFLIQSSVRQALPIQDGTVQRARGIDGFAIRPTIPDEATPTPTAPQEDAPRVLGKKKKKRSIV